MQVYIYIYITVISIFVCGGNLDWLSLVINLCIDYIISWQNEVITVNYFGCLGVSM